MKIAYGRVSTQKQADAGALQRQELALLHQSGADEVICDVGSGTNTSRTGYQRLCGLIADGQVTEVRVADQDRLNRNVQADLEFFQLCEINDVRVTDLNGRELEMRTPDGELLSTVVSALNQHRSKLYAQKVKRALAGARKQGKPAVSLVPYGLRKVRDNNGRLVGIEIDPDTHKQARERIEWFLSGESISKCSRLIADHHGLAVSNSALKRWFYSPQLNGRLAWLRDAKTAEFTQVDNKKSFEPLITDAEWEQMQQRLKQSKTLQGLAGKSPRMLTGLCRCSVCGKTMTHRQSKQSTLYLRCVDLLCPKRHKSIRVDRVFAVLQYSLPAHARALLPVLNRPKTDPEGVYQLQVDIKALEGISGTEALVEQKREQINELRLNQSDVPSWLLIGALRSPTFWFMDDAKLNGLLRLLIESITVEIRDTPMSGVVTAIKCRTSPAMAPLPLDQDNILMKRGLGDIAFAVHHEELMAAAMKALG